MLLGEKIAPTVGMINPHQLAALVEASLNFTVFAPGEKMYLQGSRGKVLVKIVGYTISTDLQEAEVEYSIEPLESLRKIYPRTELEREFDWMTVSADELLPLRL